MQAGTSAMLARILSDTDAGVAKGALFDNGGELVRLIRRPTTPFQSTITGFVHNRQAGGEVLGHA